MITRSVRLQLTLAVAVAVLAAGCGDRPSGDATLFMRLGPDPSVPRDEQFLTWGEPVTIGDASRVVLSASKPVSPPAEVTATPGEARRVGARIPPELKAVPWMIFESVTTHDGQTTMMRSWPVAGMQAGGTYAVSIVEERVGDDGVPGIRIWPAPDLAKRDVETAALRVPPHASLEVGVGIEPPAWSMVIFEVEMKVAAVASGRDVVLRTIRLDPRRPYDRKWNDLTIPLDQVAGQTVRFRFSARPVVGGTALCSLPVWADPTIVDARD